MLALELLLALTPPATGAVAKPPALELALPFEPGERVRVVSGYGPSAGSSLHDGTTRTCCTNDYHALDFELPERPNGGLGRPVLAALPGRVVKAGWATAGWANYGQRVMLEHDGPDGQRYLTLYAHLHSVGVAEGQQVARGAQLGTLGDSCQGDAMNLSCPFFAPHLHFALHQGSQVGGSGTGGSYGGRATVPEPFGGVVDLVPRLVFTVPPAPSRPEQPARVTPLAPPAVTAEPAEPHRQPGGTPAPGAGDGAASGGCSVAPGTAWLLALALLLRARSATAATTPTAARGR